MTPERLTSQFSTSLDALLGPRLPQAIGLAVSGGGDSMALLSLAHDWAAQAGRQLWVITVDHGLREESAAEARMVADTCARLGHPHATASWAWDGTGNLQAQAREARLGLIDRWRGSLRHVVMGHTLDDVAETFLMRLERGAGVRGLSAMRPRRRIPPQPFVPGEITGALPPQRGGADDAQANGPDGFDLLRPCLALRRDELRDYLRHKGMTWADDPSNEDEKYDRVRMRKLLTTWQTDGFGPEVMAGAAQRLARVRPALDARACDVWRQHGRLDTASGDIHLSRKITDVERDTGLRILSAALRFISSAAYPPREASLQALWDQLAQGEGQGGTLHGCALRVEGETIRIFREYAALAGNEVPATQGRVWDHRWRINTNDYNGMTLRALGEEGWAQIKAHASGHAPFHSARSLPSVWDGRQLVWCGALGLGQAEDVLLRPLNMTTPSFTEFLISH